MFFFLGGGGGGDWSLSPPYLSLRALHACVRAFERRNLQSDLGSR